MLDRMRRESEENKSEMEKAKDMLKMRSVKIQKAIGPEVGHAAALPWIHDHTCLIMP